MSPEFNSEGGNSTAITTVTQVDKKTKQIKKQQQKQNCIPRSINETG